MGLSSKKSTTKETATTTPNVPDWLLKPAQGFATQLAQFQEQGPAAYTPTVAPAMQQTWADAGGLTTGAQFDQASGLLGGVDYDLAGSKASDFMGAYRDLFDKDIIDPVLSDFDVEAGKTRAAQAASGARNAAFRGGRFGLREAATEGELSRGRAATYGGLLKDAANFALTGAQGDAARAQAAAEGNRSAQFQGAGLLSNIGTAQGADTRATLDLRNRYGAQATDIENAIKQYPLEYQQQLQGLFAGINPSDYIGQTINSTSKSKSSGSLGALLGDMLIAGASGAGKALAAGA